MVGVVMVFRDVAERRRIERERSSLIADLETAVRARDDFLSIASHELRNPVNAVRLQLILLWTLMGAAAISSLIATGLAQGRFFTPAQQLVDHPMAEQPDARPLLVGEGRIELRNVSFAYDSQPVLQDARLIIQPG